MAIIGLVAQFIFLVIIFSRVSLLKSEKADELQRSDSVIKYDLITDETIEPNKFEISYNVNYGEFVFTRFEKCRIVDEAIQIQEGNGELLCSGKTKFSRIGNIKNVTNFDDYIYSSNGFNHTGETFKVNENYFRLNSIDLVYGLEAEPISTKLNITQVVKKLQFGRFGKDSLTVNFTIDSTYFAMNRTETFLVGTDYETGTDDLICYGQVKLLVRNSDNYTTLQKEYFTLDEDYSFVYLNEVQLLNCNNTNNDYHNGTNN